MKKFLCKPIPVHNRNYPAAPVVVSFINIVSTVIKFQLVRTVLTRAVTCSVSGAVFAIVTPVT